VGEREMLRRERERERTVVKESPYAVVIFKNT
jgi:hypothetical protein